MTEGLYRGDCLDWLRGLEPESVDAIVTDPPYGLAFMGKDWDHGVPGVEFWREALRVAKPGAHLLAFGGTRTYHRLACAIEDAGWDVRDSLHWVYGTGFPKSLDVSKALDKEAGAEREVVVVYASHRPNSDAYANGKYSGELHTNANVTAPATDLARKWAGWGTALKPAHEPIVLARKPLVGTVAANVREHGTGGLNIDGCRVGHTVETWPASRGNKGDRSGYVIGGNGTVSTGAAPPGRWPANLLFSCECDGEHEEGCPVAALDRQSGNRQCHDSYADTGGTSRFFYCSKASKSERDAGIGHVFAGTSTPARNAHPTVKPIAIMEWLITLVTPPSGLVIDPFLGSGTTAVAAIRLGRRWAGAEITPEYWPIIEARVAEAEAEMSQRLPLEFAEEATE